MKYLKPLLFGTEGKDPQYKFAQSDPEYKSYFENLWSDFLPFCPDDLADFLNKTRNENFLGQTWHMWLLRALRRSGFEVQASARKELPDICAKRNGMTIWIECVSPKNAENPQFKAKDLPVNIYDCEGIAETKKASKVTYGDPEFEKIVLRILNSLQNKSDQHRKFFSSAEAGSEAYIIAMNLGGLMGSTIRFDTRYLEQALWGIGKTFYTTPVDLAGTNSLGDISTVREFLPEIPKGEVIVPANFFLNDNNSHISGVLFSPFDVFNLANHGLESLSIFNNRFAKHIMASPSIFCCETVQFLNGAMERTKGCLSTPSQVDANTSVLAGEKVKGARQ